MVCCMMNVILVLELCLESTLALSEPIFAMMVWLVPLPQKIPQYALHGTFKLKDPGVANMADGSPVELDMMLQASSSQTWTISSHC